VLLFLLTPSRCRYCDKNTINSRTDFLSVHLELSNRTCHIICFTRLTPCGGSMNFRIKLFVLLFKMILEQADIQQDKNLSTLFLMLKEFPILRRLSAVIKENTLVTIQNV
jgi:hypothetical protein